MASNAVASRAWSRLRTPWWATPVAAGLVAATLVRDGLTASAIAFAAVQLVLVALSVIDFETRRLPNVLTLPTAVAALVLRAVLERSELASSALAGGAALLVFGVLMVALRGAFGMGDVKLAGMLGFVLGEAVVPALVIGVFAGGVASVVLLLLRRARWTSSIAYGPYLALGGAIAILAYHPTALA